MIVYSDPAYDPANRKPCEAVFILDGKRIQCRQSSYTKHKGSHTATIGEEGILSWTGMEKH